MWSISFFKKLLSFALLLGVLPAWPQGYDLQKSTGRPVTIYNGTGIERVDTESGNLHISIPLLHLPGRGLDLDIVLSYNSKIWKTEEYSDPYSGTWFVATVDEDTNQLPSLGWSIGVPQMGRSGSFSTHCYEVHPFGYCDSWVNYFTWVTDEGTRIRLGDDIGLIDENDPPGSYGYWSFDGTYTRFDYYMQVGRYKDGVTTSNISGIKKLKDTNGNYITCTQTKCIDTLGRVVNFNYSNGLLQSVTYKDSSGTDRAITFTYQSYTVFYPWMSEAPGGECTTITHRCGYSNIYTLSLLKKVTLPNGLSYQFEYLINPDGSTTGEISKLILPTGGYIRYTYGWNESSFDFGTARFVAQTWMAHTRVVATRSVSEDGQTASEMTWTYEILKSGTDTKIIDPLGFVELHQTSSMTIAGSISKKIQKKNPEGITLQSIFRVMGNDSSSYNDPWPNSLIVVNPRVTKEITWLEGAPGQLLGSCVVYTYSTHGNVSQKEERDWGTECDGPVVRRTIFQYLHQINTAYAAPNVHILDRVTSQIVYDASWMVRAQTITSYDTTTPQATSNVIQHDYTSHPATYNLRGNPTQVKRWLNTSGQWLTTTNTFNDVGNLLSTTDPGGHTTLFSYSDNFYNYTPSQPTSAYATQITYPTTNGINHIERAQFYFHSGLVAASCGQNFPSGATCTVGLTPPQPDYATLTYDLLNRPITFKNGEGGQTTLTYNEDSVPITITQTSKITSSQNLVATSVYDGLGRTKQTQLNSNPVCVTKTDNTYDEIGRRKTLSNPYCSTAEATYGITTYEYDALGRVTKVIPPDGSATSNNITTVYWGNATIVTDQAGKQRVSYTDALGRLVRVDEPTSSNGTFVQFVQEFTPATPGTGWVDITGTEQSVTVQEQNCWYETDEFGFVYQVCDPPYEVTYWDAGVVSITVNGFTKQVSYGQGSTGASIAAALASAFNADPASPVTASASGIRVNLTSKTTGAESNYSLSATSWTNDPTHFSVPSFVPVRSGPNLTGGADATYSGGLSYTATPAVTLYTYDALDNLICVVQKGTDPAPFTDCASAPAAWRPRTFVYNSLSQLISATNPESGTITYSYDADGNLVSKTDARGITTSYTYDALHRLTGKTYSNGDPAVSYFYDQTSYNGLAISNGVGRRTGMSDAAGAEAWSYDAMGRVVAVRRTTHGVTKTFTYTYNLDGSLASVTYPSGRRVDYSYDAAGRVRSAVDVANNINYALNASYAPHGALASVVHGPTATFAGIEFNQGFNNRLQPASLRAWSTNGVVLDFEYCFNATVSDFAQACSAAPVRNNGNVARITNHREPARSQRFTYDELNRIQTAQTQATTGPHAWGLAFGYDSWANLLSASVTQGSAPMLSVGVNAKNQINNTGFVYDAAGNLVAEPGRSYSYNAENQLVATGGVRYSYDGDGRRVAKLSGNPPQPDKLYWYGMSSLDALAETDGAGNNATEYIFFGGKRVARREASGAVFYYFADHLGSSRIVTNATGQILDDSDYYPFGGERVIASSGGSTYKFTGKERDPESGLDYFIARYYASGYGRFLSPDSTAYSSLRYPQLWNLYGYGLNNPLTYFDPTGHEVECKNNADQCLKDAKAAVGPAAAKRVTLETRTQAASFFRRVFLRQKTVVRYFIKIEGNLTEFRNISANANRLADLVADKRVITVEYNRFARGSIWSQGIDLKGGGAQAFVPSQGYDPKVVIDPGLLGDSQVDTDAQTAGIPGANSAERFAHELLGHVWGELYGGAPVGTKLNFQYALHAENEVRKTDPVRGVKPRHHNEPPV